MRVLHEHTDGHAERNFFADLVLGLIAAATRVERLSKNAAQFNALADARTNAAAAAEDNSGFQDFALGVISFSRRVLVHAEAGKIERVRSVLKPDPEAHLRDLLF